MDTSDLKKSIQIYFDACFEGSGDKIAQVFHDSAHIYTHSPEGTLIDTPKADFVKRVNSRPADSPSFPREEEILSIDFLSEKAAAVRIRVRVLNNRFTDLLSFMLIDGKWVIIAKLFQGVSVE